MRCDGPQQANVLSKFSFHLWPRMIHACMGRLLVFQSVDTKILGIAQMVRSSPMADTADAGMTNRRPL